MTDRADRRAKDVRSDSPAPKEAAKQTRSGMQGARRHYYDDERPSDPGEPRDEVRVEEP